LIAYFILISHILLPGKFHKFNSLTVYLGAYSATRTDILMVKHISVVGNQIASISRFVFALSFERHLNHLLHVSCSVLVLFKVSRTFWCCLCN